MNKQEFLSGVYTYSDVKREIEPIVEKHLSTFDIKLAYLKVTDFSQEHLIVLAISKDYRLWKLEYTLYNPYKWQKHVIQSSAKLKENSLRELKGVRQTFTEIQGFNEEEANQACLKFFLESKTFCQKAK